MSALSFPSNQVPRVGRRRRSCSYGRGDTSTEVLPSTRRLAQYALSQFALFALLLTDSLPLRARCLGFLALLCRLSAPFRQMRFVLGFPGFLCTLGIASAFSRLRRHWDARFSTGSTRGSLGDRFGHCCLSRQRSGAESRRQSRLFGRVVNDLAQDARFSTDTCKRSSSSLFNCSDMGWEIRARSDGGGRQEGATAYGTRWAACLMMSTFR